MPERVPYQRREFIRDRFEPDTRTMLQLMQLAGQARTAGIRERGQAGAQGLINLGQFIAGSLGNWRQDRERQAALTAAGERQAREDAMKARDQELREADLIARIQDREADNAFRAEQQQRTLQADAEKRGDLRADKIGYGPMGEQDVDTVMQSPARGGDVRYAFGPGTANGPELQPTQTQRDALAARTAIEGMGGTLGPNGQVVMPPKPEREPNPTEASLALLAAKGDKMAAQALATLRSMRAPSASAGPRPLTQTAEAQIINRLNTQWNAAAKPIKELERQVALMDTGMEAVTRGDMAQGAQMVLVTFQKILDPPSVVRESEFMRSAAGQSLMNRVRGAFERLQIGGAGIRAPELQKFADLAREAAAAQRKASGLDATKKRLGMTADRYGIPQELIFDMSNDPAAPDPQEQVEEWGFDERGNLVKKGGG